MNVLPKGFLRYRSRATALITSPAAFATLLRRAAASAHPPGDTTVGPSPLTAVQEDLTRLLLLLRAWHSGRYRGIATQSVVLVVAALIYLLAPVDTVPDVIPVAGLLDDAAVIGIVATQIRGELDRFAAWQRAADRDGSQS